MRLLLSMFVAPRDQCSFTGVVSTLPNFRKLHSRVCPTNSLRLCCVPGPVQAAAGESLDSLLRVYISWFG